MKTISLGSDHAGYLLKEKVKTHLQTQGYQILDFGTHDETSCDYPDYCRPAAESVASQESLYGIVFGGSGNGEAMVTNKVDNVRCTVCWDVQTAQLAKQHNNANMISIGARLVSEHVAILIVDAWLNATFEGGRHIKRLDKLAQGSR